MRLHELVVTLTRHAMPCMPDLTHTCACVTAVKTDLDKALKEGKSIILEGFHIDPALFLHLIGTYTRVHLLRGTSPTAYSLTHA
jgi:hypothetical protein